MLGKIIILLASLCLATNGLQSEKYAFELKRHSLLHHEPPVKHKMQFQADQATEHFITQRLDNFNHQDTRTFQMRYLKDDVHFKSGGPIFIMIGGEWEISADLISSGQLIYDMAKEHNGLLMYTEHRFYGKSLPSQQLSDEDLKYLSVEQSLADLAHFVREITADKELNATGGVIVVGASYSATMATWFRQKYPHLVKGAWASSAPLQIKVNFFEYTEVIGKTIREIGGEECYQSIEHIFKTIDDLADSEDTDTLRNVFQLCDDFNASNIHDIHNFVNSAMGLFYDLVQSLRSEEIQNYCDRINSGNESQSDDPIQKLYSFSNILQEQWLAPDAQCMSLDYQTHVDVVKDENALEIRPWYYQVCTEFGWFQTTDSKNQPFGSNSPEEYHKKFCEDVFGSHLFTNSSIENKVEHTNDMYGGLKPSVTNVYFTHGSLDPWHRMGILNDLNEHSPTTIIPGISHSQDLGQIDYGYDSEELIKSKFNIISLVEKWLKYDKQYEKKAK